MLRTELGTRVLTGKEGRLFAESLLSMLQQEISMGESNPDWNPTFVGLTHEQQLWLLNAMMRAALLEDVDVPQFTAEGEAALAAVYETIRDRIIVEIDLANEALRACEPVEDWMLSWRRLLLAAAREPHLTRIFGHFVEPGEVTDAIRRNNADENSDPVPIWPEETCVDLSEWEFILDLLRGAVFFDSHEIAKEVFISRRIGAVIHVPEQVSQGVCQAPSLDVDVIHVDHHGNDNRQRAAVGGDSVFPDRAVDARRGIVSLRSAVAAQRPFDPGQRQPQDQERDKVRDHEGTAFVLSGQPWKTQEVAQPHGAAHHCQNHADPRTPGFLTIVCFTIVCIISFYMLKNFIFSETNKVRYSLPNKTYT